MVLLCLLAACRTGRNYPEAAGPRYGGSLRTAPAAARSDTLRIVSFNIEFSNEVPRAIAVLRSAPALRDADIILLQEMTAPAARMVADSLAMAYVYYPAIYNRIARRDVGNAVLSRWPIVADTKLILPARSRYAKTQRIATGATIQFGDRTVRAYSTHLGTPADVGKADRAEQLRFIMLDAARFEHVVLGGDMNSTDLGHVARDAGYEWPTATIPRSNSFGRIDHIFLRGLKALDESGAGTVMIASYISDHSPIWVTGVLDRSGAGR